MLSQIQLIGNLGSDPDMSYTTNGTPITKFNIAVTTKQSGKDATNWYRCVAFRGLGETINTHCRKGQQLFVQGELSPRAYTTNEGKQGVSLDVTVDKFSFVGNNSNAGSANKANDLGDLGDLDEHPF